MVYVYRKNCHLGNRVYFLYVVAYGLMLNDARSHEMLSPRYESCLHT